jgi:hypothetical protein
VDDIEDLRELQVAIRLDLAYQAFFKASGKEQNVRDIARKHVLRIFSFSVA